jgi:hypothetical protein
LIGEGSGAAADVLRETVGRQLFGGGIDTFATSLAAIRLLFLDEHSTGVKPQLYVHDMLLHSPARPQRELFSEAERAVVVDPEVDDPAGIDEIEFDAVVGNPPYGAPQAQVQGGDLRPPVRHVREGAARRQHRDGRPRHVRDVLRQWHRAPQRSRAARGRRTASRGAPRTPPGAASAPAPPEAKSSQRVRAVARGRVGLQTSDELAIGVSPDERQGAIAVNKPHWVPFAKGEGFGEYWRAPRVAIDWPEEAVAELSRRNGLPSGTPPPPALPEPGVLLAPGSDLLGRLQRPRVRAPPAGGLDLRPQGKRCLRRGRVDVELFLLGYLNSALATYFMKRIVNTTATADIGYLE